MKQVKVVVKLLYTLLHRLLMLILYRHHESPLLIQLQTNRERERERENGALDEKLPEKIRRRWLIEVYDGAKETEGLCLSEVIITSFFFSLFFNEKMSFVFFVFFLQLSIDPAHLEKRGVKFFVFHPPIFLTWIKMIKILLSL
jgi:hypothetical protein